MYMEPILPAAAASGAFRASRTPYFEYRPHSYETLIYSTYYAPRGRQRLYMLGNELSYRYLYANDLIIGIIGSPGSGKSTLVRGLFPGLELTNDDEGANVRQALIYDFDRDDFFSPHTFHIDIHYELAFKQRWEIAEAISKAVSHGRRVVIEHFDLIWKTLGYNAQILFGIGEEVIVARPGVFGPFPEAILNIVNKTIKFRLMAHSAEDITTLVLEREYNYKRRVLHSDVKHGFVINFPEKPEIDIAELESKVKDIIAKDLPIAAIAEDRISVGRDEIFCTGVRTHVKSSSEIVNFRLAKEFRCHPIFQEYMLVGRVGIEENAGYEQILSDSAE
ncbi:alanine-tRNA synthetase second additional domain-containing protein [Treponema sp.]